MLLGQGEQTMYRPITIIVTMLLIATTTTWADDYIYDRPYGGKKVGRVDENGFVYDKAYGGNKIGRVKSYKFNNTVGM